MSDNISRKILVAVDLGTTFSAVAWCQTARPEVQTIIMQWPNENDSIDGATSDAVPTELLYIGNGREWKWGFQIKESEGRIQRFKLELDPDRGRQVSYLTMTYPDSQSLPPDYSRKATDLTRDYLKKLHSHLISVLKSKLGEALMSTTPIEYILTVPAIWQDRAKDATRVAAQAAGFSDKIHMVSEPEAAITYALDAMDAEILNAGDTFVCCDAGGGTADLISYTIEGFEGKAVKIKEAASGTGDLCGSSFLNARFRQFMIDRFGDDEDWDNDTLEDAMQRFEKITKREFHGEEADFIIPVPGLADDPAKRVKRGKLRLTLKEMASIFEPVVLPITTLITSQVKATKGKVKAVLLVGGFGQSPYLRKTIQNIVGPQIEVLQPPNAWTAVVRGALIKGLALTGGTPSRVKVSSRVARSSHGVEAGEAFNFRKHRASSKYWDAYCGAFSIQTMTPMFSKGETLKEIQPVNQEFYRATKFSDDKPDKVEDQIFMYDGVNAESPPLYRDQGWRLHATIKADLSKIPERSLKKDTGSDGKKYYKVEYEIRASFYSAHTEYSLWYKKKCYGKVEAKYE